MLKHSTYCCHTVPKKKSFSWNNDNFSYTSGQRSINLCAHIVNTLLSVFYGHQFLSTLTVVTVDVCGHVSAAQTQADSPRRWYRQLCPVSLVRTLCLGVNGSEAESCCGRLSLRFDRQTMKMATRDPTPC